MSLKDLLTELESLDSFQSTITNRVWDESKDAVDLDGTVLNEKNIKERVDVLAARIVKDFPNGNPVLVGLMDGAIPFAALLCSALNKLEYNFNYTTMTVSSYGNEMTSGSLSVGALPKVELIGRTVLVVDDVCDTGKTLKKIKATFLEQCPKDVKLMTLVDKVQERPDGCNPDYAGFKLSKDAFIIGMGLDYRQDLRNKTSIRTANLASLPTPAEELLLSRREEVIKLIKAKIEKRRQSKLEAPGDHSIFTSLAMTEISPLLTPKLQKNVSDSSAKGVLL